MLRAITMTKLLENKTGSKFELVMRFSCYRNLRPLSSSLAQEQPDRTNDDQQKQ